MTSFLAATSASLLAFAFAAGAFQQADRLDAIAIKAENDGEQELPVRTIAAVFLDAFGGICFVAGIVSAIVAIGEVAVRL